MSPQDQRDLRLVLAAAVVLVASVLLAAFLHHTRPAVAKWREAAARDIQVHQARLLQEARARNERDYIAFVQAKCGDNAWPRPREGALPVCTDKHGRVTGPAFTGVQP